MIYTGYFKYTWFANLDDTHQLKNHNIDINLV